MGVSFWNIKHAWNELNFDCDTRLFWLDSEPNSHLKVVLIFQRQYDCHILFAVGRCGSKHNAARWLNHKHILATKLSS